MRTKLKGNTPYMALKLDMSKAYIIVKWLFLEIIMTKLGFNLRINHIFFANDSLLFVEPTL